MVYIRSTLITFLTIAAASIGVTALYTPSPDQYAKAEFNPAYGGVSGAIRFIFDGKTQVTKIKVNLHGLPKNDTYGFSGYPYHIHEYPVPYSGDCQGTGGHFDPEKVNVDPTKYKCEISNFSTCEAGDLSGKHGKLGVQGTDKPFEYRDWTISYGNDPHSVTNGRSIVIHYPNTTRLACANIVKVSHH